MRFTHKTFPSILKKTCKLVFLSLAQGSLSGNSNTWLYSFYHNSCLTAAGKKETDKGRERKVEARRGRKEAKGRRSVMKLPFSLVVIDLHLTDL